MHKSASNIDNRFAFFAAKGVRASALRRRKHQLVRRYGFPEELLGGSLTLAHRGCGKPGCRCASGDGHPMWTLTYCVEGVKHVQVIPAASVSALEPLVKRGREWLGALRELTAINAQLVAVWRQEQRQRAPRRTSSKKRHD